MPKLVVNSKLNNRVNIDVIEGIRIPLVSCLHASQWGVLTYV
jgi:hypothetical protein